MLALWLSLAWGWAAPPCARAQASVGPRNSMAPERDIQLAIAGHWAYSLAYAAGALSLFLVGHYAIDPASIDRAPLDRHDHRAYHRAADRASDGIVYAAPPIALVTGYLLDGTGRAGWLHALRTPIVMLESWGMSNALVSLVKNTGVCRPYAWHEDTRLCGDATVPDDFAEQRRAFPSSHASNVGAVAGALWGLWFLPSRRDSGMLVLALASTLVAATEAALRVRAGAHSVTDVAAGLAIGAGVGIGTAALHRVERNRLDFCFGPAGLTLSGTI
jgi:membrane-associated phospholipid phosphatase